MNICSNPDILSVMKYVNIVVTLIKIIVPIVLIISLIITFIGAMTSNSETALPEAIKEAVNKALATALVFLIPTFVNVVIGVATSEQIDYASCFDNATNEYITLAYNKQAENYVAYANTSLLRSDYNIARSKVNKLKDEDKKNELLSQLDNILPSIEEREKHDLEEANKVNPIISSKEYAYPLGDIKSTFTACFGGNDAVHKEIGSNHHAVDLGAPQGTPIYAVKAGKIKTAKNSVKTSGYKYMCYTSDSCGNYVVIDHQDGSTSTYCHMKYNSLEVKKGDMVQKGQKIGEVGTTGCSTGFHLHFAINVNGAAVNPVDYVDFNVTNPGGCL